MKARKSLGKPIKKFDPVKFEKNVRSITEGLVHNLNANMTRNSKKK